MPTGRLSPLERQMRRLDQTRRILAFMKKRKYITTRQARRYFRCERLSARIFELRHKFKLEILTHWYTNKYKAEFVKYPLVKSSLSNIPAHLLKKPKQSRGKKNL